MQRKEERFYLRNLEEGNINMCQCLRKTEFHSLVNFINPAIKKSTKEDIKYKIYQN